MAVKGSARYCVFLLTVVIGAEGTTMAMAGERSGSDPGSDLLTLEREFSQAIIKADLAMLDQLVSEDWVVIGPEGRVISKGAFFAVLKSGALTHSAMELEEPRVRLYGDAAVITGRVAATGTFQGQPFTTRERSTDVFVRQQGRWRCVLTQLTTIAAE